MSAENDGPDLDYTLRRILATLERIEKRLDEPVKVDHVRIAGIEITSSTEAR